MAVVEFPDPQRAHIFFAGVNIVSVKLLDNEAFYGFRVRRTVDGRLYQEYFSLKREGAKLQGRARKLVEQAAEARDQELAQLQQRALDKNKSERCFNDDGTVRGISYLLKTEKSGNVTPIFQIGIASALEKKIVCTSFSLNAHGGEEAWRKAVETYARHKLIRRGTKLYKQLLDAIPREARKHAL